MSSYVLIAGESKQKAPHFKFNCKDTSKNLITNVSSASTVSPFSGSSFLDKIKKESGYKEKTKFIGECSSCKTKFKANASFIKDHDHFNCLICNADVDIDETGQGDIEPKDEDFLDKDLALDKEAVDKIDEVLEKVEGLEETLEETVEKVDELLNLPETEEEFNDEDIDEEDLELNEKSSMSLAMFVKNPRFREELEIISSNKSNTKYVLCSGKPVATIAFEKCNDTVKSLYLTADFEKAFKLALESSSAEAMKDFGIEPMRANVVSAKSLAAYDLKSTKMILSKEFKDKESKIFEDWQHCFSTATVLCYKGISSLKKPMILSKFISEKLRAHGVLIETSEVNKILEQGILKDCSNIIEEALVLYDQPIEARQATAKIAFRSSFEKEAPQNSVNSQIKTTSSVAEPSGAQLKDVLHLIKTHTI